MENREGVKAYGAHRLRVYQLTLVFCEQVEDVVRQRRCRRSLAEQVLRAADSVLLNIAEGAAHFAPGQKAHFYRIAKASVAETLSGLQRVVGARPNPLSERARRNGEMIAVMLTALTRAIEPPPP